MQRGPTGQVTATVCIATGRACVARAACQWWSPAAKSRRRGPARAARPAAAATRPRRQTQTRARPPAWPAYGARCWSKQPDTMVKRENLDWQPSERHVSSSIHPPQLEMPEATGLAEITAAGQAGAGGWAAHGVAPARGGRLPARGQLHPGSCQGVERAHCHCCSRILCLQHGRQHLEWLNAGQFCMSASMRVLGG